jgi:HAD superfamily hydrolase (TIGR01509 family)
MGNKIDLCSTISAAIQNFNNITGRTIELKAIFFDMDGVLFDSMPYHAKSWIQAFTEHGLDLPEHEPFMNEGSTAHYTIAKMFAKYKHTQVTADKTEEIKVRKHEIMQLMPQSEIMKHMPELLSNIGTQNIDCWVVTGSAQAALYNRLEAAYNGSFTRDKMITAHDVKHGKPHPEPYLKAIENSGYGTAEAIVIENAPLGVESAKAAGLFTIAVNTGPIDPDVLKNAGADLVLNSTLELLENWPEIYRLLKS